MRQLFTLLAALLVAVAGFAQAPKQVRSLKQMDLRQDKYISPQQRHIESVNAARQASQVDPSTVNTLPIGTVTSSAVTAIRIGQASNSYTSLVHETNQFGTVTNVGTNGGALSFIYRQNIQECGGSTPDNGRYRYSISTDGGNTWNLGAGTTTAGMPFTGCHGIGPINVQYTRPSRYPNLAMFSRSGSSSVDSLALVYSGPVLQPSASGWDGSVLGTVLDAAGTFANGNVSQEDYIQQGGNQYFNYSMVPQVDPISGDQNFWYLSYGWDGMNVDIGDLNLVKGTWDEATRTVNWNLYQTFNLNYNTVNIDGNRVLTSTSVAFSPDGRTGFISALSDLVGGADSVFSPVFIESTDGGVTWGAPVEIDLSQCSELMDTLMLNSLALDSIGPGMFDTIPLIDRVTTGFDSDLEVDSRGYPHLFVTIGGGGTILADPNYSIFSGVDLSVWDVTKDQFGDWTAMYVGEQGTFRGEFGDIATGGSSSFTLDPYMQVSRSDDGTLVFYSWTDTDSTSTGTGDNNAPDLITRAYDISANKLTTTVNRTFDDLDWATKAVLPKTGNIALQNQSIFTVPTVIQSLDGNDAIAPVSFWYFSDISWDRDNDFNEDPQFCYNCKENPFTNTVNINDASCMMNNDGDATIVPGGGIGPYTYLWDANAGSATSANVGSLGAGVYTATVTDDKGCEDVITVIVNNIGAPTAAIDQASLADPSCFGETDGTATVMSTGGSGGNTFTWSNGEMTAAATMLPAGQSTVQVTDNAGCSSFAVVNLSQPPAITFAVDGSDVSCNGDGNGSVEVTAVGGGAGGFTFAWNDPNNSTTQAVSGLGGGTYDVTITDMNGCTATASVTVNEPTALAVNTTSMAPTDDVSNDGTATAIASGGTPPYTYSWSNGATGSFIFSLGCGKYVATVTDANNCIVASDTVDLTAPCDISGSIADELNAGIAVWDLYPNPASSQVQFAIELNQIDVVSVNILGLDGKAVVSRQFDNVNRVEETINLSNVAAGMYMVRISTSQGSATRKLIVK